MSALIAPSSTAALSIIKDPEFVIQKIIQNSFELVLLPWQGTEYETKKSSNSSILNRDSKTALDIAHNEGHDKIALNIIS